MSHATLLCLILTNIVNLVTAPDGSESCARSSGRTLGSRSGPMLDGSGFKAMPRLIPAPNSGSL